MASTYSSSLRLELMATGDQSGTWGDTTNTNLGTLLEQAITGVLSVAQGDVADLTLTTVNGGSDQARNAVVNVTGALTAQRNVVVQTANKLYLIKNSTTGGFSIVAKTTAGTGVTILNGTSQWVYSDGTNVVKGLIGNGAPDANGNVSGNNFLPGFTTTATAAGTTVLTVSSTQLQYFTGTTTQTITLPVVSTLTSLGQGFDIVNLSTGALTVNSSGGNLVTTVSAGSSVKVQAILLTGTSAASWNAVAFSVPNPLTLSGSTAGYTPLNLISTEAGAAAGPILNLYRDSSSPAANDILAQLLWNGEDSAGNTQEFASMQATIVSATSGSEASTLDLYTQLGGSRVLGLSVVGPNANSNNFRQGYTTTATAAGTTTLTVSSTQIQRFTGTSTQNVDMPVTSTLTLGHSFEIINESTGNVTVRSSGANSIIVVPGGMSVVVKCILTSGTTAASWTSLMGAVAQAYACRAWVNFNGTGTVAIRASSNVSSITDNGTGDYDVNFTTAMADANYCLTGMAGGSSTGNAQWINSYAAASNTASLAKINTTNGGSAVGADAQYVFVAVFR